jgi:hypothetical protein
MKFICFLAIGMALTVIACSSGDAENCPGDYGFEFGGACAENGNSKADCDPGASCTCDGVTLNTYICFEGQCVTSLNCDAWCAASEDDRRSCY